MTPAHPPLPTAWNFPFHPEAGNQTSILISESSVGFRVAAMRQNAGRSLNLTAGAGLPPKALSGGMNSPAATGCARVIVVFDIASDAKLSHVAPHIGAVNIAQVRISFMESPN